MNTTQWIAKYYAACNGRMVVHTGDIIQNTSPVGGTYCNITNDQGSGWTNDPQWLAANQSMSVFLKADIPYTWDARNHDGCLNAEWANATDDGWIGWNYAAFNPVVVQNASLHWTDAKWVGSTDQGMSTAVTFSGMGRNFLLINIQYNGVVELAWAQGILSDPAYAKYYAIIATHGFIDQILQVSDINLVGFAHDVTCMLGECAGQSGYPNIIMTMNGHYPYWNSPGNHNITTAGVAELMFNRQEYSDPSRGFTNGYSDLKEAATVTVLTFSAKYSQIFVNTFTLYDLPKGQTYLWATDPLCFYSVSQTFTKLGEASSRWHPPLRSL